MSDPHWDDCVPLNYRPGMNVRGRIVEVHPFGVFVELEPNLRALVHVTEIRDAPVAHPSEALSLGDAVLVKILRVDREEQKIGASIKRARGSSKNHG